MNLKKALLFVCFVWLIWVFVINNQYSESAYILSDVDNNIYEIRGGKFKSESYLKSSSNILGEINNRIIKLIEHLEKTYDTNSKNYHFIKNLKQNYNYKILSEGALDSKFTTYTIDKNNMHICLRTRDQSQKIYNIDILMYVILHELAHLCNYDVYNNPIYGHGSEFRHKFKFLLLESVKIGIYNYENYSKNPKEYCGIVINTSILSENQIKNNNIN